MKDELKPLFESYRPEMSDASEYMQRLQTKMTALEGIKRYTEEQRRLQRRRLVVAFAVGGVLGAATVVYLLVHPVVARPSADLSRLALLLSHARPLLTALTIVSVSVATAVFSTLQLPKSARRFSRSTPR